MSESVESLQNRIRNYRRTIDFLKSINAPQHLIDSNEQSLEITRKMLKRKLGE